MRSKLKQRGMSFVGVLFVGGLIAVTALIAVQVFPTVMEYVAVKKAVQRAATGQSIPEARELFDKQAEVDAIKSISGKDIEITKPGEKLEVSFAYQREIHLVGPAFLTLKYTGRSK